MDEMYADRLVAVFAGGLLIYAACWVVVPLVALGYFLGRMG